MSYLDTKNNRVTMKMDVSYTDHSHVIGKGGKCSLAFVKYILLESVVRMTRIERMGSLHHKQDSCP